MYEQSSFGLRKSVPQARSMSSSADHFVTINAEFKIRYAFGMRLVTVALAATFSATGGGCSPLHP